jgi:putative addiction module component (TIGR02574 family)
MGMTVADLEAKILELAPKERARLAQRLLESLEVLSESEVEALWLQEADRRDQTLDADPSRAIPGADVLREARALLLVRTPKFYL